MDVDPERYWGFKGSCAQMLDCLSDYRNDTGAVSEEESKPQDPRKSACLSTRTVENCEENVETRDFKNFTYWCGFRSQGRWFLLGRGVKLISCRHHSLLSTSAIILSPGKFAQEQPCR